MKVVTVSLASAIQAHVVLRAANLYPEADIAAMALGKGNKLLRCNVVCGCDSSYARSSCVSAVWSFELRGVGVIDSTSSLPADH